MIHQHNWRRTLNAGMEMAVENARKDATLGARHVMWELLCEAAKTSQLAYSAPPRTGYPAKAVMPDAPADVTQWQLMSAYIKGELDEMPADDSRPPTPSAEQVSRCEAILDLWHRYALRHKGPTSRIKKAVYLKACGVSGVKLSQVTGVSRQVVTKAQHSAMQDMWDVIGSS